MRRLLLVLIAILAAGGAWLWRSTATRPGRPQAAEVAERPGDTKGAASLAPAAPESAPNVAPEPKTPAVEPPTAVPERSTREAADPKAAELARASWVSGRVVFPPGTPESEEAFVEADGRHFSDGTDHRARVAPDGSFRVAFSEKSRSGWLKLEARYLYLAEVVRWKKDESTEPIALAPVLGGRITGRVVPPSGTEPRTVEGKMELTTTVRESANSTSSNGRSIDLQPDLSFAFDALHVDASYAIAFDGPRWIGASAPITLEAGEERTLELALRPGVRLAGKVTDESGAPLGGVEIDAHSEASVERDSTSRYRHGRSFDDGSFTLGAFAAGTFELEAKLDGYERLELDLGKLAEGEQRTDLALVLHRGHAIAGSVRWPDGTPAEAKLTFIAESQDLAWNDWKPPVEGQCGADGGFRVSGLGPGTYCVRASAMKEEDVAVKSPTGRERTKKKSVRWMAERSGIASDASGVELLLSAGLAVTGSVVDDLGRAVSDFRVSAERAHSGWSNELDNPRSQRYRITDGGFELAGLTSGDWNVTASGRGYAESEPVRVTVPSDTEVRLVLPREGRLSGTVLDPGGAPVAGAEVLASKESRYVGDLSDQTDSSGTFELRGLEPGPVTLRAESTEAAASEPLAFELVPGEERTGLVLQLRAGATLRGEVVRANGAPLAGAEVQIQPEGSESVSDAEGCFELENLSPGEHNLSVEIRDGVRLHRQVTLETGETKRVVVQEPSSALVHLHGRVRAGGEEVDEGSVHAHPLSRDSEGTSAMASTQFTGGAYELDLPGAGRYSLGVSVNRSSSWLSWRTTLEVPAVSDLAYDVSVPLGRIGGRVVDSGGRPLAGVSVRSEPEWHEGGSGMAHAITDADGRYELTVPAGRHGVVAGGERGFQNGGPVYAEERVTGLDVADGSFQDDVDFALTAGGALEGTVRGTDGRLIPNASLWSRSAGAPRPIGWAEEGTFRIEGLEPGTHWITASANALTTRAEVAVEIVPGETRSLALTLVAATRLHVRGTDAAGALVGCDVDAVDSDGRALPCLRGTKGEAWFGPLVEGRYTVRATRDGKTITREVELSGGETERELTLAFE